MSLLVLIAWLLAALWAAGAALTLVSLARQKFLKPTNDARLTSGAAPTLSILVPARNEAGRILSECLRSLLAQDYARFEVVAIDDRSTDTTLGILRTIAETDSRLRVIEGKNLPDGWLGKPHALQQGLEASGGEWVLTTDADVRLHPAALRTAIDYALTHRCDAVSLIPNFEPGSFWEYIFIPTWGWGMLVFFPLDLVNLRRLPLAIGFGAFFLARRDTLKRLGGFGAVRAEVIEDMRLAEKLKRAGAYLRVEYAPDLVSTRLYTSFRELWESATRNLFAAMKFSVALTLVYLVWTFAIGVLPALLFAVSLLMFLLTSGAEMWKQLLVPSLIAWGLQTVLFVLICVRFRVSAAYGLTCALGNALACAVMLDSTVSVLTGRGVTWKGRKIYERAGGIKPPRG